MAKLKFAMLGAGFWARFQLPGWYEAGPVECVAVYNRTRSRAEWLASRFSIPRVYDDPETLLRTEQLDFVDIVSGVETHAPFVSLAALGSHPLDAARFLFGEADSLFCNTQQVHSDIRGEDCATVLLRMQSGMTVVVEMAYAENYLERDRFPETAIFVEGSAGSAELQLDHWLRVTTKDGTHIRRVPPLRYPWADPAYDIVHSSIVACQANILSALMGQGPAETTGEDNLKTVRLVFGCYKSARSNTAVVPRK